jgi:hypothetical protein
MTIRSDSYGTVSEVVAYTRRLLSGSATFDNDTIPTLAEVEKFIDRASGILNSALRGVGFSVPVTNSTAKLACDDWVVSKAALYVEYTQPGYGFNEESGVRVGFGSLHKSAQDFAKMNALGFKRLGVTQTDKVSDGLIYTGETVQADRTDRDDTSIEQPLFTRRQHESYDSVPDSDTEDD